MPIYFGTPYAGLRHASEYAKCTPSKPFVLWSPETSSG
jgi:hypothetical protein